MTRLYGGKVTISYQYLLERNFNPVDQWDWSKTLVEELFDRNNLHCYNVSYEIFREPRSLSWTVQLWTSSPDVSGFYLLHEGMELPELRLND